MLEDREGPLTIVVTDVVASTSLTTAVGDVEARRAMRRHDELVRRLVDEHGGTTVKGLGDGFLLVFTSVRRAVTFAVELQRGLHASDRLDLQVRIGINVGEVLVEAGDVHGQAVNATARIAGLAQGGEILVSDVTRQLLGTGPDVTFEAAGEHELRGFDQAWSLHRVRWRQPELAMELPSALQQARPTTFVGRERTLELLRLQLVRSAPRPLVLLAGEPGIGKTGVTAEFAAHAHGTGTTVLFGRSDEDTVVPYQPFTEALHHVLDRGTLGAEPPARLGSLRALLPRLGDRLPPAPPADQDPEVSRYQLFDSVAWVVQQAARSSPVLLILDDLHWADRPTLLLLQHVLRTCATSDLLIVGTYRDTDLDRRHPLAAVLAELRRRDAYTRIPLRGLPPDAIRRWLEQTARHELGDGGARMAQVLWEETEGNPFFVAEIVRHLTETGAVYQEADGRWTSRPIADLGLPEGVREVIGRRLSRLSDSCNVVLAAASVLGRSAHVQVLAHTLHQPQREVLTAFEEAIDANLVTPETTGESYAFTHALVRETLYEELSLPRKQRLHLAVAEAMEATPHAGSSAATVALHYRLAGVAADVERVMAAYAAAGEEAFAVGAYEEAADHWRAALDLLEQRGGPHDRRARLLERFADVSFVSGLDRVAGVEALEEALDLQTRAGRHRDQGRLRSKLGRTYVTSVFDMDTARASEHFDAALALAGNDRRLRAYALVGLASTALWRGEITVGEATAEEAMSLAQELGDRVLFGNAAAFLGWHRGFLGDVDAGLDLLEESWSVGEDLDSPYVRFQAAWLAEVLAFNVGAGDLARAWIERVAGEPWLANAPLQESIVRGQRAWACSLQGELDVVRGSADDPGAAEQGIGGLCHLLDGDVDAAVSEWARLRERGAARGNFWDFYPTRGWSGQAHLRLGDGAEAVRHFELLEAPPVGEITAVSELWARPALALARLRLGAVEEAAADVAACRRTLQRYRGPGAAASLLHVAAGALAGVRGDRGTTDAEFEQAITVLTAHGNRWYEVWALHDWGRALDALGDVEAARRRLDAARDLYQTLGFGEPWLVSVARDRSGASLGP